MSSSLLVLLSPSYLRGVAVLVGKRADALLFRPGLYIARFLVLGSAIPASPQPLPQFSSHGQHCLFHPITRALCAPLWPFVISSSVALRYLCVSISTVLLLN